MKPDQPQYEVPIPSSAWTQGVLPGAGIYFLEGRCHIAPHTSPAELSLLERGALLVATVRFGHEPRENGRVDQPVQALRARAAVGHFGSWMADN